MASTTQDTNWFSYVDGYIRQLWDQQHVTSQQLSYQLDIANKTQAMQEAQAKLTEKIQGETTYNTQEIRAIQHRLLDYDLKLNQRTEEKENIPQRLQYVQSIQEQLAQQQMQIKQVQSAYYQELQRLQQIQIEQAQEMKKIRAQVELSERTNSERINTLKEELNKAQQIIQSQQRNQQHAVESLHKRQEANEREMKRMEQANLSCFQVARSKTDRDIAALRESLKDHIFEEIRSLQDDYNEASNRIKRLTMDFNSSKLISISRCGELSKSITVLQRDIATMRRTASPKRDRHINDKARPRSRSRSPVKPPSS
jgi:chromosome segregation ATPase